MVNPEAKDVFELSDYFHQLGNAIGEFIQLNKSSLTNDERNILFNRQVELLRFSGEINIIGVSLVSEDIKNALQQLNEISEAVKNTVKKVLIVQDLIELSANLVGLGTSVISMDAKSFISGLSKTKGIIKAISLKTT